MQDIKKLGMVFIRHHVFHIYINYSMHNAPFDQDGNVPIYIISVLHLSFIIITMVKKSLLFQSCFIKKQQLRVRIGKEITKSFCVI